MQDVLDFSRLNNNLIEVHFQEIQLVDVFKSCIKALQNELQKKKAVQIDLAKNIRDLPTIVADPDLLQRVFMNLLDNAIKYSWSGNKSNEEFIKIKANPQTDLIDIMITNWGIGIDESEYEKIFVPFYRCKNRDVKHTVRGVGLGLATCREFVKLHGGSIRVKSIPTFGDKERTARYEGFETTFTVRLPRKNKPGRFDIKYDSGKNKLLGGK